MSRNKSRIVYIQRGSGLQGPGRIGRVTFSKTGRTLYYHGSAFGMLRGGGYKTTHFEIESGHAYWISGPRRDGQDTLYPGAVAIDDDVREEYWRDVRQQPESAHRRSFRSLGRHARRATR